MTDRQISSSLVRLYMYYYEILVLFTIFVPYNFNQLSSVMFSELVLCGEIFGTGFSVF
jgi:hypothetical protein